MTLKTTRWYPDTCDCIIEYQWEDPSDPNTRVHTPSNIVYKCPAHQSINNVPAELYDVVYNKENKRKNLVYQAVLDNAPTPNFFDIDQWGNRALKHGITFNFSFSGEAPNRVLTINYSGITLTQNQINSVTNKLEQLFGVGTVILNQQ